MLSTPVVFALLLAIAGLMVKDWLLRQPVAARAYVGLGMLAIAMWIYAYALYDACHGRVDVLHNPFACRADRSVAFNPNAWRVGRAR